MTSITADQTAPGPARSPMLAVRVQDLADMIGLDPACVGDLLSGGACLCCDANPVIGVAQRHSPGGMASLAEPLACVCSAGGRRGHLPAEVVADRRLGDAYGAADPDAPDLAGADELVGRRLRDPQYSGDLGDRQVPRRRCPAGYRRYGGPGFRWAARRFSPGRGLPASFGLARL